jgi:hypothetical protein
MLIASGLEAIISLGHRHKEFFDLGHDSAGHPSESSPEICEFIATEMFWVFRYTRCSGGKCYVSASIFSQVMTASLSLVGMDTSQGEGLVCCVSNRPRY